MVTNFILQALSDTRDGDEEERQLYDHVVIASASLLEDEALTLAPVERALIRQAFKLTMES
jgi:hypothetical protein